MNIELTTHNLDLTPSVKEYVEDKLGSLEKFIGRFDEDGGVVLRVTLERTTEHHHKGKVFKTSADLHLPGTVLHAEDVEEEIHAAIDKVRDKLSSEIETYRTQHSR